MRIVHDVEGPMQVTAFIDPLTDKDKRHTSARIELLACSDPNYDLPFGLGADEAIYIEGDAAAIIKMLDQWKSLIESNAEMLVKEGQLEPGWRFGFEAQWTKFKKRKENE